MGQEVERYLDTELYVAGSGAVPRCRTAQRGGGSVRKAGEHQTEERVKERRVSAPLQGITDCNHVLLFVLSFVILVVLVVDLVTGVKLLICKAMLTL